MSRPTSRRRMMRATVVPVALLAGSCLALTACSKTADSSSDGKTVLTVQFLSFETEEAQTVADAFEETHPDVEVQVESITSDQFTSNISLLSSDDAPDVGWVPFNNNVFTQLTANDALEDLSDVWESSDLENRYGSALASAVKGGKQTPYVVSVDTIYYGALLYNKDLFEQYGIDEPENHRFSSYAELKSAVDKLRAADVNPIELGGSTAYGVSNLVDPLLPTSADEDQMANYLASFDTSTDVTAKYTDQEFVDVLDTIKSYNDDGFFQDGFLGQDADQADAAFQAGQSGMSFGGNLSLTEARDAGIDVDWALLPAVGDTQTQLTSFASDSLGIPKTSKNKDLAKEYLELFMTTEMQTSAVLDLGYALPVVSDVTTDGADLDEGVASMVTDAAENGSQSGWTSTVPSAIGQGQINPLIQKMYEGDETPEQIAEATQEALEEYRSSGTAEASTSAS